MPNKLLGQHFLRNLSVARKIVEAIAPERGDSVIEVGPGHGELTRLLAAECLKTGAKITAIEKDPLLAEELSRSLKAGNFDNVEIVTGDILTVIASPALTDIAKAKIVGNIPYYLTGHLLRIISELPAKPERCVFMVQKEVALRLAAKPPDMNRLAASVQFWAEPKIVCNVPKEDFSPQPKIDSAVVRLERIAEAEKRVPADTERYYKAVRALFAQPRKTVLNNLAAVADGGKEKLFLTLKEMGLDPESRPQNLSVAEILAVAKSFF